MTAAGIQPTAFRFGKISQSSQRQIWFTGFLITVDSGNIALMLPILIPSTVNLTTYSGGSQDFIDTQLQTVVNEVEAGRMTPRIGRVLQLDDIIKIHRCMEDNAAGGKIVVLT